LVGGGEVKENLIGELLAAAVEQRRREEEEVMVGFG
jgi:hypothetical protein